MPLIGGRRLAGEVAARIGEVAVAVAFDLRLARALAERGLEVIFLSDRDKDIERAPGRAVPWSDVGGLEGVGAAVIGGAARRDAGDQVVAALARVVGAGAPVVLLDRGDRTAASRCALLGGLTRLEQELVGRTVLTCGPVG